MEVFKDHSLSFIAVFKPVWVLIVFGEFCVYYKLSGFPGGSDSLSLG